MQISLTGIRRRTAGVLAACMTAMSALGSLPVLTVHAEGGSCGANATWDLTNGTLTISGSGEVSSAAWAANRSRITSVVIESGITVLPNNAFNNYTELTSLVMADTVTSLGNFICFNCSSLKTVDLSDSVTDIPTTSFYYCRQLVNLHLPEQLQTIGASAFYGALGLTELTIPNSVVSIGTNAFYGNNIKKLTLGNSLEEIGGSAFDMSCFESVTIPESVTSIGAKAFTPYYDSVVFENNRFTGNYVNSPGITTIYGVAGSEAERFANDAGLNFVPVESSGHTHSWSEWTLETPATCTANGRNVRTCSGCDEKDYQPIPATGHEWGEWEVTAAPDCTAEGTKVRHCANCDETETQAVPAAGHSWGHWVTEKTANCESEGVNVRSCSVCGESERQAIPALGGTHNWSDWHVIKEPSATEAGEQSRECSVCGEIETQVLPPVDAVTYKVSISANEGGTVDPSGEVLVEQGKDLTVTIMPSDDCAVGDVLVDGVSVGAVYSYTFDNVTANHTLEVVFVSDMPQPHEHTWSDWEVVTPASCEKEGKEVRHCTGCDETEERTVKAIGHNWSDWVVTKEPTTSETGEQERECSNCHEKQTESLPKLDAVTYTVSITANEGGAVTPDGEKMVEESSSLTVEILPHTEHDVKDVLVDGVSVGAVYSYTFDDITANHTLEVIFEVVMPLPHEHTWSDWEVETPVSCEKDGKEVRHCTGCDETEERTVKAAGHKWSEWTDAPQQKVVEYTEGILLDATEATAQKVWQYELRNLAGNGTLTQVILDLTAPFAAAGWSGGGGALGMSFGGEWYQADINAASSGNGTLAPDSWTVTVDIPASYKDIAQDFSGDNYIQIGWWWGAGNILEISRIQFVFGEATGSSGTLQRVCEACGETETMDAPEPEKHTVKISCNEGGSVLPNGETDVEDGGALRVQIEANDGFLLGDVLVDGVSVLADVQAGVYTFSNVTEDHTLSVIFIKDEPQAVRECVEIIVTPKRAAWLSDETAFDMHDFTVTAVISENGSITKVDITDDCAILETPAAAPGIGTFSATVNYQGDDSGIGAYVDRHTVTAEVWVALRGDIDGNGVIGSVDSQLALLEYLEVELSHNPSTLTPAQSVAADVNNNGNVSLDDSNFILHYYLESFVGNNPQWSELIG